MEIPIKLTEMDTQVGLNILNALKKRFKLELREFTVFSARREGDPFKVLVATILSQNTNDKNSIKAYENLSKKFTLRPEVLANVDEREIEEAIKVAGLYKTKSRALKEVSKQILDRFHGDIWTVLNKPLEEARRDLLSLPKVGPKTADVLLLFMAGKPTFPVDTHIARVSRRMGLAPKESKYEGIRMSLMSKFPSKSYLEAHLLLIMLGRRICKAVRPICSKCPVKAHCNYYKGSPDLSGQRGSVASSSDD